VSAQFDGMMVEPCPKGHFYDVVVEKCELCSDVCNPLRVSPLPFNCRQGCAGKIQCCCMYSYFMTTHQMAVDTHAYYCANF